MNDGLVEQEVLRTNRNLAVTAALLGTPAALLLGLAAMADDAGGKVALAWGMILGIAALLTGGVRLARRSPERTSLARTLARWGNPTQLSAEIAAELAAEATGMPLAGSTILQQVMGVTLTAHWILRRRLFTTEVAPLSDLIWVHRLDTRRSVNGIRTGTTIEVLIHLRNGHRLKLDAGRELVARHLLEAIRLRAPWAITGYSDDLDAAWRYQRAELVGLVDDRRTQAGPFGGDGRDPERSSSHSETLASSVPLPSRRATLILVLGILGLFTPLGTVAWILGQLERRAVARGLVAPSTALTAGWALGIAGTVLFAIVTLLTFTIRGARGVVVAP